MRVEGAVAIALTAALTLSGCSDQCNNELIRRSVSPNGLLSAELFSRNCGATTGFNTQLSIVNIGDLPSDEAGNVLIADGQVLVTFRWLSETRLSVAGAGGSGTFKQESEANGVTVVYE